MIAGRGDHDGRRLDVWTGLLVAVAIAALLSAEERASLVVAVLVSALVCSLRLVRVRIPERVWTLASVLALGFFVFGLTGWSRHSSILSATELLLYVLANKVHHLASTRDRDQLFLVTFLLVLAVSVLAVEIVVIAFFLVYLFVALCTMELLHERREQEAAGALLLLPRQAGVSGHPSRRVALAMLGIGAIATPLFFAFPRIGAGTFSTSLLRPQHVSGFGGEVDLDDISTIKEDPTLIGRVTPQSPAGRKATLLRAIGFRVFDGRRWSRDEGRSDYRRREPGGLRFVVGTTDKASSLEWFEVTADLLSPPVLPVPVRPVYVEARSAVLQRDAAGTLLLAPERNQPPRITYRVAADLSLPPPAKLRDRADPKMAGMTQRYLQLPRIGDRVRALAASVAPGEATRIETTRAVERLLGTGYSYSLAGDPSSDALETFLFERKAGHCELFATAMAVLLRARGVPARVVNGFRLSEWSDVGGYFIVRQSDAHAWVEVYFADAGWVSFDPTPPDPAASGASSPFRWLSHLADLAAYRWDRYVISWSLTDQRAALLSLRDTLYEAPATLRRVLAALRPGRREVLVAVAFLVGAAGVAGLLRRGKARSLEVEAVRLYQDLLRALARGGATLLPSTAPGEILARYGDVPSVRSALEIYIGVRFAGEYPDARAMKRARRALGGVRTALGATGSRLVPRRDRTG